MRVDARERLLGDNGKAERADAMHVGAAMSRDELVAFVLHELGSRDPVAAIQTAAPSKKR